MGDDNKKKFILWLIIAIFVVSILAVAQEKFLRWTSPPWLYDQGETVYFNESYFNATLDARLISTVHPPWLASVIHGTLDDGDVLSLRFLDGDTYNISEATGVNALQVLLFYENVTNIDQAIFKYSYTGGSGHEIEFQLFNWVSFGWDSGFLDITDTDGFVTSVIPILDSSKYISGTNTVTSRFIHIQSGNPAHDFIIDYAVLVDGATVISTSEHDSLSGRDSLENHPWSLDTGGVRPVDGNFTINEQLFIGNLTIKQNKTLIIIDTEGVELCIGNCSWLLS